MWRKKRTLDELLELKRAVDVELAERSEAELEGLKAKLELLAEAKGVSLSSLFGPAAPEQRRKGRRKREVKVKYRDAETGETWSGIGKPRKWLQEKLDAGALLQDFAVA